MVRTQVLQEIRRMRFNEAYGGWQERRLTQEQAARLPGVCERTFRRYVDRYEDGEASKKRARWVWWTSAWASTACSVNPGRRCLNVVDRFRIAVRGTCRGIEQWR